MVGCCLRLFPIDSLKNQTAHHVQLLFIVCSKMQQKVSQNGRTKEDKDISCQFQAEVTMKDSASQPLPLFSSVQEATSASRGGTIAWQPNPDLAGDKGASSWVQLETPSPALHCDTN
ncbi:uncharacterized protein LOC132206645 isoform X4 [Stegostoma tigrinum]|uniref:uncharacterized protein LOC132206645 isoform X4 n=1 Tax=Stegostoma tigrinum TaxID=3053191 RepID=UPI00286FD972|nr:uncharacterized protein LOC132206645 isoform X4 [Stegostoma tigrinum]